MQTEMNFNERRDDPEKARLRKFMLQREADILRNKDEVIMVGRGNMSGLESMLGRIESKHRPDGLMDEGGECTQKAADALCFPAGYYA